MHANIPLSQLVAGRFNPRRVKPERDAHRRMVASIRAHGLLEPLIVRPTEESERYLVIAGGRRLAALREVFRGEDPKIACQVHKSGDPEAISLAENFAREPMHPLDEAEAFARLIREDDKDVGTVATDFGVTPAYVRQRMKLATLSDVVKNAYRNNNIDTGTAEAFAAVPEDKQLEVWQELNGSPRHADHVRNIIANAWIDAKHALFDTATLPPEKVSRDLFEDRVLIERQAFFAAQAEALTAKQHALKEEGWSEVVIAPQAEVQDRLWRMDEAPVRFDEDVTNKLAKLQEKRDALETKFDEINDDQKAAESIQERIDALDVQAEELTKDATVQFAEPVKATGTVFLILDPDGRLRQESRIPRTRPDGQRGSVNGVAAPATPPAPPTPDELSDRQKATLYTIQALTVRQALLKSPIARKRVLVLILHEKVRSEALAIRHEANGTTLHAEQSEGFTCPALDALRAKRLEVDPFGKDASVDDLVAYNLISSLSESQLDALIDLLTVERLTAHLARRTEMVCWLAQELGVDFRKQWCPNATWLGSYQKLQLSNLIGALQGAAYGASAEKKKKSELVEQVTTLFADAVAGRVSDPDAASRVNQWLPAELLNLRKESIAADNAQHVVEQEVPRRLERTKKRRPSRQRRKTMKAKA
jgi:ParB family transcriptional regulator, chromosome partitioning protein